MEYSYLVEAQCYKLEGCGLDFPWGYWIFQLISSFQPHYYLNGGKGRPERKDGNLTTNCEPIFYEIVAAATSHKAMSPHGKLEGWLDV